MKSPKFLEQKIKRQLKCNGVEYTFKHMKENEYHELIDCEEVKIIGIYHEVNSYESRTTSDSSITHKKPQPMILCLLEDAKNISVKDKISINDSEYEVTSILDVQNYGVVADISLIEVFRNE